MVRCKRLADQEKSRSGSASGRRRTYFAIDDEESLVFPHALDVEIIELFELFPSPSQAVALLDGWFFVSLIVGVI